MPRGASASRRENLVSSGSVLVSSTTRSARGRLDRPPSPDTTASAAATLGSDMMMVSTVSATADGDSATSPPASACAARRSGKTSKPTTVKPAARRLPLMADPITPRPTTPTRDVTRLSQLPGRGSCPRDHGVGDVLEVAVVKKGLALERPGLDELEDLEPLLGRGGDPGALQALDD